MTEKLIEKWKEAKGATESAKTWQSMAEDKSIGGTNFKISKAHCKAPGLTRAGQYNVGGHNYWETGERFNDAILTYLVDGWEDHWPKVLEILEKREDDALLGCKAYIDQMVELIGDVEQNDR